MSMTVAQSKLSDAYELLSQAWLEAREQWDDAARDHFRADFMDPLGHAVGSARKGMGAMNEVMAKARTECE